MEKYIRSADVETILSNTPGCGYAISLVRDLKPCEVKPVVYAHWIIKEGFDDHMGARIKKAYCSHCDKPNKMYKPPFCPHCGATMEETTKEV